MSSAKLTTFLLGKQYIGIEHYSFDNKDFTAIVLIENTKDGLTIIKKDKVTQGQLSEKWNKNLPFFIILNTNQIIQKEIQGIESNDEKLLHRAFPNILWTEFYYEIFRMQSKSIIAISRKSYVDQLLATYSQQKVSIAGVSLGICSLSEIINYSTEKNLFTNTQIISLFDQEEILQSRIEYSEKSYELNGITISSSSLLSFSGILKLLVNSNITSGNIQALNNQLRDAYNQKTFFIKSIKIFIGVLLGLLLINFFVFNYYYKKTEEASQNLLLNKSSIETIDKVKERIISKEQRLKNTIEFTSSKSSFIINEIIAKLPQSILLSELVYNPLEKKIKNDEPILVNKGTILFSGTTLDNNDFTNWVSSIEKIKFINKVVILHFGKNDVNETVFSIHVKLNEDDTE